jgi:hypothetical protein
MTVATVLVLARKGSLSPATTNAVENDGEWVVGVGRRREDVDSANRTPVHAFADHGSPSCGISLATGGQSPKQLSGRRSRATRALPAAARSGRLEEAEAIRPSPHLYNTLDQIARTAEVLLASPRTVALYCK